MGIKAEIFSFEIIIVNNNNLINAWAYKHKFYLLHVFFSLFGKSSYDHNENREKDT